jgi:hypothetical protein
VNDAERNDESVERRTVYGEVLSVSEERISVRLDSGEMASLPAVGPSLPGIGERGEFVLEASAENGTLQLSRAPMGLSEDLTAFDREFDQLQSVLSYHREAHPREAADGSTASLDEERIEAWIAGATEALARLKKHRAKRLSERSVDRP